MPYLQEVCIAGKTIEVTKRYTPRYKPKKGYRAEKKNPTTDEMKAVNLRRSALKLVRLINTNFGYKDIHLTLTYKRESRPAKEEAKKHLSKFMRRLRAHYKREGLELKYICVTEYKKKAIHHHLVINGIDSRIFPDLWKHGRPKVTHLDDAGDYSKLANYLVKETNLNLRKDGITGKRWSASKNLKKPIIIKKPIKANSFSNYPQPKKGYYIDKSTMAMGIHEVTGHKYQFYRMIKLGTNGG